MKLTYDRKSYEGFEQSFQKYYWLASYGIDELEPSINKLDHNKPPKFPKETAFCKYLPVQAYNQARKHLK